MTFHLSINVNLDLHSMSKLIEAAKEGNAQQVRELLPASDINEIDEVGNYYSFRFLLKSTNVVYK